MGLLVSVDTGGTHTDIVVLDGANRSLVTHKVPTRPGALAAAVLEGVETTLARADKTLAEVDRLVYGTTLVTNIILERDAVPVGLITTRNFRDVLAIGRAYRNENIYDIRWRPPEPLVPRRLRFGVTERIDARGHVVEPLDEDDVREALAAIVAAGVDTVAVCLINGYVNPVHEQRIAAVARAEFPALRLSVSSDILREFREFERTSTTVANAFVMKPIDEHFAELEAGLRGAGLANAPCIMRANGGIMSFAAGRRQPVALTHSGPMGGIVGSAVIAREADLPGIITFDMGGTSSDVSLVSNATPTMTTKSTVAGLPVKLPSLDLVTVGAGGGSIAWIDAAGALKVGPKSAGARPGPACYGNGGTQPTVTDANLLLGRLNPDWFLAGAGTLDIDLARKAVGDLADRLGLGLMEAALGIVRISESHMVNAIKLSSVKRGVDPRGMTLVGFGGAGPLHAIGLARELGIRRAVVPCAPGNMSALGMLSADLTQDFVLSLVRPLAALDADTLPRELAALLETGAAWLEEETRDRMEPLLLASVDLRYRGQTHELNLPLTDAADLDALAAAFHDRHLERYGYNMPAIGVELTNIRVSAVGRLPRESFMRTPDAALAAPQGAREVWFDASGPVTATVWRHEGLAPGVRIAGPAVVEFTGSTFIAPPGWSFEADAAGHLHIEAQTAQ
ncbi:hydantoin utilization protein [Acuticoccus sediminis]|uniref:Hydantoin utilization protein n=1 Tax=Acuticoccus sediminis TaxID=2184697 RepID=A0A8B2NW18_9HYPH|nr:hydantoinase/oxoprolinase family protein [Acuticoccus sediminis]RAH99906.1 hydantoin utilization protein [Acuticoccus sediminis]